MSDFIHLHCHSEYSLFQSTIRVNDLCNQAKRFGMDAVAITDHGSLYGVLEFYLAAQEAGIKPILGCEAYVAATQRSDRDSALARVSHHLVLLAQNVEGYHNLIKLVSAGHLDGFYSKPRVDKALLARHSEGLVALSGCSAGEIPRRLASGGMDAGLAAAKEYAAIFPGRFYLELQANGRKQQEALNAQLVELAAETGMPLVATNNCHYLRAEDANDYEILLGVQKHVRVDETFRNRFATRGLDFKSPEEMDAAFRSTPEALANTARIAAICNVQLDLKRRHYPVYALSSKTADSELAARSREGLEERLAGLASTVDGEVYFERLELELGVIKQKGTAGSFLVIQDVVDWSRRNGIPVGPAFDSSKDTIVGSLVAWALRITSIDPIAYGLLFEYALDNTQMGPPKIAITVWDRKRADLIDYVTRKYGNEYVAKIAVFETVEPRKVLKGVGRALGMSPAKTGNLFTYIPRAPNASVAMALAQRPKLQELYANDPQITQLLDVSRRLEGLCRRVVTHESGLLIGDRPLVELLPLCRAGGDELVTQFERKMLEAMGLTLFDIQGQRMQELFLTSARLAKQGKIAPGLDCLPLDDLKTYRFYKRCDIRGVYPVHNCFVKGLLSGFEPRCFEDLIAFFALYWRTEPDDALIEEYRARRQGKTPKPSQPKLLEATLSPTYGLILYLEQALTIVQSVASYSFADAKGLLQIMNDDEAADIARERPRFVQAALTNGVGNDLSNEIFDLLARSAKHCVCKSDCSVGAFYSNWSAWFMTHYGKEYLQASWAAIF